MYTIGQVAKFLGVSRDTLKYYEEKKLVNPIHDGVNGYRKYNQYDIHDVITTNFYREIDIEIKKIQEIRNNMSIDNLGHLLEEKKAKIREEIEHKKLLLNKIDAVKRDHVNINKYLGDFTVKEMKPLELIGEITDFTAYDEYEIIRNNTANKKAVTLSSARRVIHFNEKGIKDEKFIIVKKIEENKVHGRIISYTKCLYMVIENGRAVDGGKNIDNEIGERLIKIARENNYELVGIAYINILMTTYEEGLERVFLEMYAPIK
ncbi:hypothetical conserved protein [Oceanobacillus iheyensis HTE831]|uniref:Hypothetical conserved protein n=1 Tax=Oceanobacillus iheyensis (strain DSM 14371 / CIP 107618 / JCM 11309 / KCTC 3954 / HTE831) TaxID=221109 RepID=Q8CV13_OCEIH|nr:MerR family transcriptional regulator [Oceanobacillus iheyensis]BAC12900.1 hypothetical conserved protein [Oceanobacillus iheyensis HTE831]